MENIYLLMVVALIALAVADLVVGVSNDAVNFLNSALGSKVLSFRTIMIVASIGIFVGCVFSSGMMEVARKGIFNPGEFYFNEGDMKNAKSFYSKAIEMYPSVSNAKEMIKKIDAL